MNDYFNDNINSWLYVQGEFLTQDGNGEPEDFYYPITLCEMADLLNDKVNSLSQDGELLFSLTNGVFNNEFQKRVMFNEYALYEAELKKLYQEYKNTKNHSSVIETLNKPSIMLKLYIPCSHNKGSEVSFPMPLSSFFKLMKYQFEHPEEQAVNIEDIPF